MKEGAEREKAATKCAASRVYKVHTRHAMRSGTHVKKEEKERRKKRARITGVKETGREGGGRGEPEVVDFAHNYNPASEILQFADVAKISRRTMIMIAARLAL